MQNYSYVHSSHPDFKIIHTVHVLNVHRQFIFRDFMAIEMVDRKIRFLWNNGAGTTAITSNVTLESARNLPKEDHMWYRITAER